jgi:AcrR family transcriptional regulator
LKENDPKRDQLLASAKGLFWKHGIRRVSIEEICREADVSRMTFYKHFHDKESILIAIMDALEEQAVQQYQAIMKSGLPFREKVEALVHSKSTQTEMMSHELYRDIHQHAGPAVIERMERMERDSLRLIEQDFIHAQKQGFLRAGIHPKFFVHMLDKMNEMSHDEKLIGMYPTPHAMLIELTQFYFYGILPADGRDHGPKSR